MKKYFDLMETKNFGQPVKRDKHYQNSFSPQYEAHIAKLNFSDVLKHFR